MNGVGTPILSCERRLQKLINETTFKHCTMYNKNLKAVSLENKIIAFDKPIHIGKYTLNFLYYTFILYGIFCA